MRGGGGGDFVPSQVENVLNRPGELRLREIGGHTNLKLLIPGH